MSDEQIRKLERELTSQLNYGGIFVNGAPNSGHISLEYSLGDLPDEIEHMRAMANTLHALADAVEGTLE